MGGRYGEIGVRASVDGRSLDRESVTTGFFDDLVRWWRCESPIFTGFQAAWIDGEDNSTGMKFSLTAGAQTGSKYMVLTVELPDGSTIYEYVDMAEVLEQRITQIVQGVPVCELSKKDK